VKNNKGEIIINTIRVKKGSSYRFLLLPFYKA
jgi:hypothetical protein